MRRVSGAIRASTSPATPPLRAWKISRLYAPIWARSRSACGASAMAVIWRWRRFERHPGRDRPGGDRECGRSRPDRQAARPNQRLFRPPPSGREYAGGGSRGLSGHRGDDPAGAGAAACRAHADRRAPAGRLDLAFASTAPACPANDVGPDLRSGKRRMAARGLCFAGPGRDRDRRPDFRALPALWRSHHPAAHVYRDGSGVRRLGRAPGAVPGAGSRGSGRRLLKLPYAPGAGCVAGP
jgi:hypothetical protein